MKRFTSFFSIVASLLFVNFAFSSNSGEILQDISGLKSSVQQDVLDQINEEFGWNYGETARAVIALALGNDSFFRTGDVIGYTIVKQLKIELLEVLLRWDSNPISTGRFALFINALLATCNDPFNFFNINLVLRLQHMMVVSEYEKSLHSLTLCNAGMKLSKRTILHLSSFLNDTEVFHGLDSQALALIAISCAVEHSQNTYIHPIVNEATFKLISKQMPDGSFGNIYATGLVVQALIAAGYNDDMMWFKHAVSFFKRYYEDPSTKPDILSDFFVLPTLNLKSIAHLKKHCNPMLDSVQNLAENNLLSVSFENEDEDLHGNKSLVNEDNTMIAVTYSVHYQRNDRHKRFSTIVLIKNGETFLDVMKSAAKTNKKLDFQTKQFSIGAQVESLSGLMNDEKKRLFWMVYKIESPEMVPKKISKGIEYIKPNEEDHFLLWYHKV